MLAWDHAGLPNRLAHLLELGAAAAAVGEVALEPLVRVNLEPRA